MKTTRAPILLAGGMICLVLAQGLMAVQPRRTGSLPQPGDGGAGGSYTGPGDTVGGGGGGGGGTFGNCHICDQTACPTTFTSATFPTCQWNMVEDASVCVFPRCWSGGSGFTPLYWARSWSMRYHDWLQIKQQIANHTITPDASGNVTICTPLSVPNIQEVYILESWRINGHADTLIAGCTPGFPAIKAKVWVRDGLHAANFPPAGWEVLCTGTFDFLTHCLTPPPDCTWASVELTFNVACMDQAVAWWNTNHPNELAQQDPWLFNVGMLTCNRCEGTGGEE